MTYVAPRVTVQNMEDARISVSIELETPEKESIAFTVFIEPAPLHPTGRPVHELAIAACVDARQLLDELEATFLDARATIARRGE